MPTVLLKGGVSLCLHDANWASGWKELHSFSFVSWSLCWHPSSSECPHGHCWMPNHIQFVWQFHNAILCFLCSAAAGKVVRWGIDNRYRDLMPVRSNSSNWKQSFSIHRWQGLVKLNCQGVGRAERLALARTYVLHTGIFGMPMCLACTSEPYIHSVNNVQKLTHIHKFYEAGVRVFNWAAVIWRSNNIQLIVLLQLSVDKLIKLLDKFDNGCVL